MKFLSGDIYTKSIALILFLVLVIALWLICTTPNMQTPRRDQFFDLAADLAADIATEKSKMAEALATLDIAKIKYNLTH